MAGRPLVLGLLLDGKIYSLLHWEDKFVNIVQLSSIKWPRLPYNDYFEGQYVRANFKGKDHGAVISEISGKFN